MGSRLHRTILFCCFSIGLLAQLNSCKAFENIGKNALQGTVDSVFEGTDSLKQISENLTEGALDALNKPETQAQLKDLIANLGGQVDSLLTSTVTKLLGEDSTSVVPQVIDVLRLGIDSLVSDVLGSENFSAFLQQALIGVQATTSQIRNDLLGPQTQAQLQGLIDVLLGDSTQNRLIAMRDSVLSEVFFKRLTNQLDTLVNTTLGSVNSQIGVTMTQAGSRVNEIVLLLGGVVAILLVLSYFLFRRSRRNSQLNSLLAYQIHEMPSQEHYDELVKRIQKKAQETGIEPHLRKVLSQQGILGSESWKES